ncbi:oligosaccharide repeat unit polymerase [Bacillus lacus]|uniref:Oligosaccharide repeat unit polymerase n=1 Tax=Metabacillus lacus TaxID=1983721 RepID=A0A7X2LX46_9BACI|nr:O-antigen polymerase [Metabacillus lacus]MRX72170.1 oligosaccharide repeat unit polymerase [Metabacillus lacus]
MFYFLLWILILVTSFLLFRKVSGSMSLLTPNLISITFYYSLLASSYIGSLLIVLNIDEHYMIRLLSDDIYRLYGFVFICFIMIFMPLTMFLFSKLIGFEAEAEFKRYVEAPVYKEENPNLLFLTYAGLTLVSLAAIGYTVMKIGIGNVPILSLLRGGGNLDAMRIEASHNFSGNTIIRNIFGVALTPILSMITFIYFHQTKQLRWLALFAITAGGAVFMQVYDLAKGPIIFYMMMVILLLIYLRIIRLTWLKISVLAGFGVGLILVMYIFIMGVTDTEAFLSFNRGPIGRVILSQIAPFYLHLDLFTDRLPLLMGQSLPSSLIGLYDLEQIRSARLAMEVFFPQRVEAGTAGVLNTLFAAEAYANFGYAGVMIGTIYVALYIQIIYVLFIRLPKNPLFLTLFVYFSVNIPRVVIGGFADFLLNTLWVSILVVLLTPYLVLQAYKLWNNRRQLQELS